MAGISRRLQQIVKDTYTALLLFPECKFAISVRAVVRAKPLEFRHCSFSLDELASITAATSTAGTETARAAAVPAAASMLRPHAADAASSSADAGLAGDALVDNTKPAAVKSEPPWSSDPPVRSGPPLPSDPRSEPPLSSDPRSEPPWSSDTRSEPPWSSDPRSEPPLSPDPPASSDGHSDAHTAYADSHASTELSPPYGAAHICPAATCTALDERQWMESQGGGTILQPRYP